MKRSEMVKILEDAINSGLYQDYQFSTESVSNILEILEKAGMKPPEVIDNGYVVMLDEWEPEDEG